MMAKIPNVVAKFRGPVSDRIRIRRTTVLLFVLFIGMGALWLGVRTEASTSAQGVVVEPKPGGGFTITRVPTTTTKPTSTTTTTQPTPTTSLVPPTTGGVTRTTTVPATSAPSVHSPSTTTTTTTTIAPSGAPTTTSLSH
jgi:hypothetical protein